MNLLLKTKMPTIFAESSNLHHQHNWSQEEISLLGDFTIAMKTTVYHDGKWNNGGTKVATSYNEKDRFTAHLLFVPGALLSQPSIKKDINEGSPDIKEVIVNGKLDTARLKALYTRRLLPALLHANATTTSEKGAYVTIPGLGCGQFISSKYCDKKTLKGILAKIIKEILIENKTRLPNIRAVRFDPNTEGSTNLNGSITEDQLDYIVANSRYEGLLHKPEHFDKKYKGCDYFKIVAWDHLSYPGNDWLGGSGATDDGSNCAATDSCYQLTGGKGRYGKSSGQFGYFPPEGYNTWKTLILKKKIYVQTNQQNLHLYSTVTKTKLRQLINNRLYDEANKYCKNNPTLVNKQTLQLTYLRYVVTENPALNNNDRRSECFELFKTCLKLNNYNFSAKPHLLRKRLGEKDPLYQLVASLQSKLDDKKHKKNKNMDADEHPIMPILVKGKLEITKEYIKMAIEQGRYDIAAKLYKINSKLVDPQIVQLVIMKFKPADQNAFEMLPILFPNINENLILDALDDNFISQQKFTQKDIKAAIKQNMYKVAAKLCKTNNQLVDNEILQWTINQFKTTGIDVFKALHIFFSHEIELPRQRHKDEKEFMQALQLKTKPFLRKYKKSLGIFSNQHKAIQKDIKQMLVLFEKIINAKEFKHFEDNLFNLCELLFLPKEPNKNIFTKLFSPNKQAQPTLPLLQRIKKLNNNTNSNINNFCEGIKTKCCWPRCYQKTTGDIKPLYEKACGELKHKQQEQKLTDYEKNPLQFNNIDELRQIHICNVLRKLNNKELCYPEQFTKTLEILKVKFNFVMSYYEDGYTVYTTKGKHDWLKKTINDHSENQSPASRESPKNK